MVFIIGMGMILENIIPMMRKNEEQVELPEDYI